MLRNDSSMPLETGSQFGPVRASHRESQACTIDFTARQLVSLLVTNRLDEIFDAAQELVGSQQLVDLDSSEIVPARKQRQDLLQLAALQLLLAAAADQLQ
jgi:hypothetical protein